MEFNERFSAILLMKNYSFKEFAEKLSVPKETILDYEEGAAIPDREILRKISMELKVPIDYLICEDNRISMSLGYMPSKLKMLDFIRENGITKRRFSEIAEMPIMIVDYWLAGELFIPYEIVERFSEWPFYNGPLTFAKDSDIYLFAKARKKRSLERRRKRKKQRAIDGKTAV